MSTLPDEIAYFTDARAWGGAEVYLMQILAAARDRGVVPRVFCADRKEVDAWVEELKRLGYPVERYRPTKEFNPLGILIARRLLRGFRLVHFNKTHPRTCLPAIVAARTCGVGAVVATEHLALPPDSHFPFGRGIITLLVRTVNRLIDITVAVSSLSRDMLIKNYSIPVSRIVAIRNGMDVSRFNGPFDTDAVRAELGLGPSERVAVLVGRFAARKGHDCALSALAKARVDVPDLRMVFAGDGELEQEIRDQAARLGLGDGVVFAGFRRDVPRLLAASDLLLLPSEDECLPLVILEAMASRLPVIATDVGGISEAVEDGKTGVLISPADPDELSRALVDVLSDRERARAMGLAGRAKVEAEFSSDACASAVFSIYDDLLKRAESADRKGRA
ncbi:MAG: glycosyltransferase [Candidatus Eisenbacteria bacterium]|nr:glycosyltransferase [Candidatus Eisenbacteria bacterium]